MEKREYQTKRARKGVRQILFVARSKDGFYRVHVRVGEKKHAYRPLKHAAAKSADSVQEALNQYAQSNNLARIYKLDT
jgi:hypothetical protein